MDINSIKFQPLTSSIGASTKPQAPCDNFGVLMASEYQPRYSMATYSRQVFNVANQGPTGQTTTVGLATTYTGLCISNPIGSLVNIHLLKCTAAFNVAFASAAYIGLMAGFNSGTNVTHTSALTPRSSFFGVGATGTALVDSSATLPTAPFVHSVWGWSGTGATTVPLSLPQLGYDYEGSLILPPGAYAAIYTSTASGTNGLMGSFSWLELPV